MDQISLLNPQNNSISATPPPRKTVDLGRLEQPYHAVYSDWVNSPDPVTAGKWLRAASSDMDSVIRAHVGEPNPVIRGEAKKLMLKAMPGYDPSGSNYKTYMFNQLQSLRRAERKLSSGVSTPERMTIEHGKISSAAKSFNVDHGRDPTDEELSDLTHIDAPRIRKVRSNQSGFAESQFIDPETGLNTNPATSQPSGNTWLETVYADMDGSPTNQLILEHTLGLHGKSQLSNQALAKQLKLSAGAISQRKALIQQRLNLEQELSPFLG